MQSMRKGDYFNMIGTKPSYKDPETLKKFITPRGKILGKDKSNLTAKNQRELTKQIKYARFMALLAYTSYQQERMYRATKAA